jgi:hypothetical protein
VFLLLDFVQNDELIRHQLKPDFIRSDLAGDLEFLMTLSRFLAPVELTNYQRHDFREHALLIIEALAQHSAASVLGIDFMRQALSQLHLELVRYVDSHPGEEFNEMLKKEAELIGRVLEAK